MKQEFKRSIKTVLDHAGLSVSRNKGGISISTARMRIGATKNKNTEPLDWSGVAWSHPLEVVLTANKGDVLLTVPLGRMRFRSLHGIQPYRDSGDPFIQTLRDYLDGRCTTYAGSALESFYAEYQPRSAAHFMRLENPSNPRLAVLPATAGVMPWWDVTPDKRHKAVAQMLERKSREYGMRLGAAEGYENFGPVSQAKGELEFARLVRIMQSIQQNGLYASRQGINNIYATLITHDNDYWFRIAGGQHRIAALAALGYDKVTVQLKTANVVRRSEAGYWPLVQKGWLNEYEALAIFDRIFLK